jgi:hypothetical protein
MKPGPRKGYKQSPSHVKRKAKAQTGKGNGQWKGGVHPQTYRRIAKAKPGEIVHHVNGNRKDNRQSNLKVLRDAPKTRISKVGRKTTPKHEKISRRAAK